MRPNKKIQQFEESGFYLVNPSCQFYAGLKKGYPYFSDEFGEARQIFNQDQFNIIQRGCSFKLEKMYD